MIRYLQLENFMWSRIGIISCWIVAGMFILNVNANGQDFPEFNMSDTTITECQGILYDSGGPTAAYGNNENLTTVIAAEGIITLTFQGFFQLENNLDFLRIYNGPNSGSPLLGQYTGTTLPPSLVANSGFVTLVMTSDNNVAYGGFKMQWTSEQPMPTPPAISIPTIPTCNSSQINIALSTPLDCAWVDDASFTFFVNSDSYTTDDLISNCNQNGQTSLITVNVPEPFSYNCAYDLQFNVSIPDNCGLFYPFVISGNFNMTGCSIDAEIISTADTLCQGNCAQLVADVTGCSNYTYAWSHDLLPNEGPHNVCPNQTTTYSVTITEQPSGATVTRTITIEVEEIEILTPAQTVCQSVDDIVMQATTAGEWSGTGLEWETNIFDPDTANAGLNYIYFETEGCIDSVAITVTPIATDDIIAACPGSPAFQLEAEPAGGTWGGDPNVTTSGMFNPVSAGSYVVNYSVNGCTDLLTINVDEIGGPFELDSICQSVWYDTIPFSPFGGEWTGPGIIDSLYGVFAPEFAPAGDVQLTYTINGCSQIFNVFVKEIKIGAPYQTSCPFEDPLVMYEDAPVPVGGYWEGTGIVNPTTGLYNPSLIPNDSWTTIIYYAPNGCSDSTFIYNLQTLVEVNEALFCVSDDPIILNEETMGNYGPWGGEWIGPGTYWEDDNWHFDPSIAGVGEHTILFSNNNCTDAVYINVYPDDLPDTPFEFCSSDQAGILVTDLIEGGTWSGNGITDATTGMFDPSVAEPGSFYVYWTSPSGCNDSISITVEQLQEAAITGLSPDYCLIDTEFTFSATPEGGDLSGALSDFTFSPQELGEGDYSVTYTHTSEICPSTSVDVDFTIHPALSASISASDDVICSTQSVTLTVTAQGGNPVSGYNFIWSNGGTSIPTNTSTPNASTTISVEISDGCSDPITLSSDIEVLLPIEVVTTTSDPVCPGEDGWATAEVISDGTFSIEWNGVEQDTIYAAAGTIQNLLVTDIVNGCTYTEAVYIDNLPIVSATFIVVPGGECIPSDEKDNISIIDVSQNGTSGTWNFGNGQTLPYEAGQSIVQSYPGAGDYIITLEIQNDAGCEASATQTLCILADDPIFIPDIFSPNGDGNNDTLFVRGHGIEKIDFRIYDRWGEMVFHSANAQIGWDGNFRGQPAAAGNYFYSFSMKSGVTPIEKQGEIALVR